MTYQPQHFKPGEAPKPKGGGIILVYGHPGVGKTKFGIDTWDVATPLFYANFDRDASHLITNYKGEGGVFYDEFVALTQSQAKAALERLAGLKNAAISTGKGVFVLDNVAHADEIVTMAMVDPNDRRGAMAHGPRNLWWRDFLLSLERSGLWCILTAPAKEIWISVMGANGKMQGQATGLFDPDAWKHLDYHVVGELWLHTNRVMGAKAIPTDGDRPPLEFKGQITLSKKRPQVEGMILANPTLALVLKAMGVKDATASEHV